VGSTYDRRRFLGSAAMTMAATQFGILGTAGAQSSQGKAPEVPPIQPGTNTSLGPLKHVDAGVLNMGYAEAGPSDGPAVSAGAIGGARTVNIIAALWPERCNAMVSVSGYLIGSQAAGKMPLPPKAELE
jgi:hypothetical protein